MSFEELPLFRNSLKILKFLSLLLQDDWKRYYSFGPTILLNTCEFVELFITDAPLDSFIRDSYFSVLWFNTLIRGFSLVYNRSRYEKFMDELSTVYKEIQDNEGVQLNKLLNETIKLAKRLESMNICTGVVSSIGICLYPFIIGSRGHPFGMYVPFVNKFESPWYEIIYIYQVITTPAGCFMYIQFTSILIAFFMFGILMCKVLQYHLRNLKNLKPKEIWAEIVWCIHYQWTIKRYVDVINSLTTYIYLVEFLSFSALLCALLFLLNLVEGISQIVIVLIYITLIFSQVATVYWFANELSDQSAAIADAAYDSNWIEFDLRTQKVLKLFIAEAQKPSSILVGNVYPMSLQMLQSLINKSYSYFTLLRNVYK